MIEAVFPVVVLAHDISEICSCVHTTVAQFILVMKKNKYVKGKDFDIFALGKTLLSIRVHTRAAHQDSNCVWVP